jgi:hypothetical protein
MDDRNLDDYNARYSYNDSMRVFFISLWSAIVLAACAPIALQPPAAVLYVFRLDAPAFIELDADLKPKREIPFAIPTGCGLDNVFPAPDGPLLAIELNCAFGPAVVWLNVETSEMEQPIKTTDSHFLAWVQTGDAIYMRIDSVNRPRVVRSRLDGAQETLPISELTYDLSPMSSEGDFLFTFSSGMGLGSEMWHALGGGSAVKQIVADPSNYLSLARWSPDGKKIAFIKVPDSSTPFTVGELWVMQADGTQGRKLAKADAGHGYAPAWSPDGRRIAFVGRENADDPRADVFAGALVSNLYVVNEDDGAIMRFTDLSMARVESPIWQPDGDAIAFTVAADDRMSVLLMDAATGKMQQVPMESVCCAAWLRK